MSISVQCPNGHKISAKEKLAGKRVKCPKCGSVIQIPELESPEQDEGLVLDVDASQPEPDTDWLAGGQASDVTDDPLGLGFSDGDPLASGAASGASTGSPYAPVPRPVSSSPTKQAPAAKLSMPLILAIAGGGSLVGLLCVGLVGWLLFSGGATEVATNDVAAPAPAIAEAPSPASAASPSQTSSAPVTSPPASTPEPTPPAREPLPFDLVRLKLDARLDVFKLPGTTWASAYDEATGRLAITNDEKGILIYDLDELVKGELAPVATIPTKGLPTAVCLKPLPDRRVFVVAGLDAPELMLIDAETLEPTGRLVLSELKYVKFLTGSSNIDDPYVYYATQKYTSQSPPTLEEDRSGTAERLGRVDLLTGMQSAHTEQQFVDMVVSPNGERVYTRVDNGGGVIGPWSEILTLRGSAEPTPKSGLFRSYALSPVSCLGDVIADKYAVYTPTMSMAIGVADYVPRAAFRNQAVVVGLAKGELVFGSANDYQRLASIPLPANWFDTSGWSPPIDVRLRHQLAPEIRTGYLDVTTDSNREAALFTFGDQVVIASMSRANVTPEPSLLVHSSPPEKAVVGELVHVELQPPVEGAVIEFVPNSDFLPNEKTGVLGQVPRFEPSPKALELQKHISADDRFVILKSYEPLKTFKLPFKLRVRNEVMVATKYEAMKNRGQTILVERTRPVAHGDSSRVAVVDDNGHVLTIAAPPAQPLGKRLELAAAVNNQQLIIFVNDVRQLAGTSLPASIQIGDEKMTLVSVDDFKTALNVTRTEPVAHGVSSDIWLLEESDVESDAKPNLPVVQGNTFSWTPTADQIGTQVIRMRASIGNVAHEWFWEIAVDLPTAELPFQVAGIEPQRGTNSAVIWGRSSGLDANPSTEPAVYFIGIYDLAEKKLVHHAEVPKPIMTATLHETGVYATLVAFDMEPKADPQAESNRRRAMTQVTPTQLVRFDVETLSITEQVAISGHSNRLTVIADKYLAAYIRGETLRFNIPALTAIEPPVLGYEYPIAGRVGNGWVWDGVLWDESMTKPQLLMFPVHFERPPGAHSPPEMKCAAGGVIQMMTEGPYASTWFPINAGAFGQHRLNDFPGGLSYKDGVVNAHSWAAPSRPRVGAAPPPTSVQLIDPRTLTVKRGNTYGISESSAYLTEADGQVHVALLGKLYSVALNQLIEEEEAFRFVEQQDQFVLEVGKPAKLRYSAPGAAKYQLQLWYQRPSFHDEQPAITAESKDGAFELVLDHIDQYMYYVMSVAGVQATHRTAKEKVDRLEDHVKRITPAYQSLTGGRPKGVPFPVYISVIAEHEDGQQKAGLAHSYLLEVPIKQVSEMADR